MHTHGSVESQITTLVDYWQWSEHDRILNVLPLHHVHGLINVMNCAIWSNATVEAHDKFSPKDTWQALLRPRDDPLSLSLFMAVPTIYYSLMQYYYEKDLDQALVKESLQQFRLMVAGSASLPGPTLEEWQKISG
jgi:malonyl-CoA/methylmalonyl-CoA synthetase